MSAGTPARVEPLSPRAHGDGVLHPASMERLHATFREGLAPLARRCQALARHPLTLHEGRCVVGPIENFCTPQASWSPPRQTTPAMAAGLTDQC